MAKSKAIKLYVRRVFISDEFDESLLPRYLTFVRGALDSNDLPLNVSREILQESRVVRVMRKRLVRKTLDMLKDIAGRDNGDYDTFWDALTAGNLKLRSHRDAANRRRRPSSSGSKPARRRRAKSRAARVHRPMPRANPTSTTSPRTPAPPRRTRLSSNKLAKKGYEVLFMIDPIDEVAMANLTQYKEKKLDLLEARTSHLGDLRTKRRRSARPRWSERDEGLS